jgi:restriction system protein
MVPDFQTCMLPLLTSLKDGKEHSSKELIAKLIFDFNLTEEEINEQLPSQRQPTINNRIHWANIYLRKAGLIDSVSRGIYRITEEGLRVLNENPTRIDVKFLSKYPDFVEFQKGTSKVISTKNEKNQELEITQTPEEALATIYSQLSSALAHDLLEKVLAQTPYFFENLVVELLVKMGYGGSIEDAGKAIGKSGDEGIDGVIKEDKLGLDVIYVQAKRWQQNNTVGRPDLQAFVGALAGQGGKKGVFITTSSFTREAEAYNPQNVKIVRIDGKKLAQLMIDYNIGVSTRAVYEIKRIDLDYFEE